MAKNIINISKIKYHMHDNMRDDNTNIKKLDKKIDKIINEDISIIVYDFITAYITDKKYSDMDFKPITIKLISSVKPDNYYEFQIEITNEKMNEYDKINLLSELYQISCCLGYNSTFIDTVNNKFFKLSA